MESKSTYVKMQSDDGTLIYPITDAGAVLYKKQDGRITTIDKVIGEGELYVGEDQPNKTCLWACPVTLVNDDNTAVEYNMPKSDKIANET